MNEGYGPRSCVFYSEKCFERIVLMEAEMLDLQILGQGNPPTLSALSGFHKRQAQMIAEGGNISSIAKELGTTESRMNRLLENHAFRELIERYRRV